MMRRREFIAGPGGAMQQATGADASSVSYQPRNFNGSSGGSNYPACPKACLREFTLIGTPKGTRT